MPKYLYKAINESGKGVSDVIEAESVEIANSMLLARGYLPTSVKADSNVSTSLSWPALKSSLFPIKVPEIKLFTKQFKTMLRAGVPIVRLLQILESQAENFRLKTIINSMLHDIQEGSSLFDAFSKHPKIFSPLYCGMVMAGEKSGALADVLDRLVYIIDHEFKVKSDIKAAMQYPFIVIIFLAIAFIVLLTFVIPKFVRIFTQAGLDLPLPTRICLLLYNFFSNYWYILIGGSIILIFSLRYYFKTEQGKFVRDSTLLKIPIIGPLFLKAAMSRFASIFAILQSSGVGILDSMNILSGTIGNTAISREFGLISESLEEGRGIAAPLTAAEYFPPIVINMVAIGEESGKLDDMLKEVSDHYDVELEYSMKKLSDAIGPILVISLAAVVGFFALAIFLPMWDLIGIVK